MDNHKLRFRIQNESVGLKLKVGIRQNCGKSWRRGSKERMSEVAGSLGTCGSLALRLGQSIFSTLSLFFMCLSMDFYTYTAFWYISNSNFSSFLVTVMGLAIPWNTTLSVVDAYCVFVKVPDRRVRIMTLVVVGDWVLSLLSLAAATSAASVAQVLLTPGDVYPSYCPSCTRYPLSAAMAFFSWFLSLASFLLNIWVLPAL